MQNSDGMGVTSGAGAAVTLTLPTPNNPADAWYIQDIYPSYSGNPSAGSLIVTDTVVTQTYQVEAAGVSPIRFAAPRKYTTGKAVTLTLASGGGTVVGSIDVRAYTSH